MGKVNPIAQRIMAEGTLSDRRMEREELQKEVETLVNQMPTYGPDRLIYVRNLLQQALRKEVSQDAFKEFVKITNSYMEVELCRSRAARSLRPQRGER